MLIDPIESEESYVDPGIYKAELVNVGSHNNGIEDRFSFQFSIIDGDYEGSMISKTTKTLWTPQSKLAQTVSGLLGRSIRIEEFKRGFDLKNVIGMQCCIWVTEGIDQQGNTYPSVREVMYQN